MRRRDRPLPKHGELKRGERFCYSCRTRYLAGRDCACTDYVYAPRKKQKPAQNP